MRRTGKKTSITVYVGWATYKWLKKVSEEKKLTMSEIVELCLLEKMEGKEKKETSTEALSGRCRIWLKHAEERLKTLNELLEPLGMWAILENGELKVCEEAYHEDRYYEEGNEDFKVIATFRGEEICHTHDLLRKVAKRIQEREKELKGENQRHNEMTDNSETKTQQHELPF